jgi:hypothetical protein
MNRFQMNRRQVFGLAGGLIPLRMHSTPVANENVTEPLDFARREMYLSNLSTATTLTYVASSAFAFDNPTDAGKALKHLKHVRLGPAWAEIYVTELEPIESGIVTEEYGRHAWFVSYSVIAGAAAVQTPHASCLFVNSSKLFEIDVAARSRAAAVGALLYMASIVAYRSHNLVSSKLPEWLIGLDDLSDGFAISNVIDPTGQYDEDGQRSSDEVLPWDRLHY